ncbi:MAG: hypothetical protein DRP83_03355 [Planctomycetota bacterium]|nr:MAG: hypothetical protein DRP83_03355 [Planctomycetota bacterium]
MRFQAAYKAYLADAYVRHRYLCLFAKPVPTCHNVVSQACGPVFSTATTKGFLVRCGSRQLHTRPVNSKSPKAFSRPIFLRSLSADTEDAPPQAAVNLRQLRATA